MSQENVDVVRRVWEILSARCPDEPLPEAALEYFTEDCVLEDFPELPAAPSTGAETGCVRSTSTSGRRGESSTRIRASSSMPGTTSS